MTDRWRYSSRIRRKWLLYSCWRPLSARWWTNLVLRTFLQPLLMRTKCLMGNWLVGKLKDRFFLSLTLRSLSLLLRSSEVKKWRDWDTPAAASLASTITTDFTGYKYRIKSRVVLPIGVKTRTILQTVVTFVLLEVSWIGRFWRHVSGISGCSGIPDILTMLWEALLLALMLKDADLQSDSRLEDFCNFLQLFMATNINGPPCPKGIRMTTDCCLFSSAAAGLDWSTDDDICLLSRIQATGGEASPHHLKPNPPY